MKCFIYTCSTLIPFLFFACKSPKNTPHPKQPTPLTFIDEYVIPSNTFMDSLAIGGLSGITYYNGNYHMVSDDPKMPRFFTAAINFSKKGIDTVRFEKVTRIVDSLSVFDKKTHLDLEDICIWSPDTLVFTGEGFIKKALDPTIITTSNKGVIQNQFELPSYFASDPEHKNRPRHNGVFEGLTPSYDHKGIWAATELPLILDGEEPTYTKGGTPVRITYFDYSTKKATSQFAYPLDKLSKDPKGAFGVNGVTAILQLDTATFWILERAYSKGYGNQGNSVKLYEARTQNTSNTLDISALDGQKITLASKKLVFDFETIRDQLTDAIIDNIEGMTFGPILEDGSQSVLFVSDNNFNPSNIQINQVLLFSCKSETKIIPHNYPK